MDSHPVPHSIFVYEQIDYLPDADGARIFHVQCDLVSYTQVLGTVFRNSWPVVLAQSWNSAEGVLDLPELNPLGTFSCMSLVLPLLEVVLGDTYQQD